MIIKNITHWFTLTLILLATMPALAAPPSFTSSSSAPIDITADRLDIEQQHGKAVFQGDVLAKQEDMTVRSQIMTILFATEGESSDVQEIIAENSVTITLGAKVATCETAHFYTNGNKLVLTGNPLLKEGQNVIEGVKIIFFLDEDRSIVEGKTDARVKTTIFPGQKGLFDNQQ
ncbi:MAG: hypothetical protein JXO49_08950 [Deltaproteobacteria bacterium]|nr:hypothetical protein [Candidatus Anaeroferrophillus wilburensis]MBN2889457.1 hypothetical protein [Deltaproteobacteria bacterium]